MKRRTFSDDHKASVLALLAANRGNSSRTARECDVLRQTIDRWKKGQGINDDVRQLLHVKKEELRDLYAVLAANALTLLSARLGECSALELSKIAATSTDRFALLE